MQPLFEKAGYRYVGCRTCGSGRLAPLPTLAPPAFYDRQYFEGRIPGGYADYGKDEALHRRNARRRLAHLARRGIAPPGRLADVGCGFGYFLDEARQTGWQVQGVDVSAHACERAAALGLAVVPDLASVEPSLQLVCFFQVLEHMIDPWSSLGRAFERLAPGGGLVAETWDRSHPVARAFGAGWQQVAPPSVVHLFSRKGLLQMAARAGFVSIELRRTSKLVSPAAVAGHLVAQHPRWQRWLALLERRRLQQLALPYGLGDLVTLTARKPAAAGEG